MLLWAQNPKGSKRSSCARGAAGMYRRCPRIILGGSPLALDIFPVVWSYTARSSYLRRVGSDDFWGGHHRQLHPSPSSRLRGSDGDATQRLTQFSATADVTRSL